MRCVFLITLYLEKIQNIKVITVSDHAITTVTVPLKAIVNLAALKPILSWLKNVKITNSGNEIREIRLFFSRPRLSVTTLLKSILIINLNG